MYLVMIAPDIFGVYSERTRNHYGTPLMFRGSLSDCLDFRKRMEGLM